MSSQAPRKILVLELWGLGDLTFSTVLIRKAVEAGETVHVLGKPHAKPLLEPTFPSLKFFPFQAGWTKFIHKYRLWNWNWKVFFSLILQLRREHYDAAVSARDDPRDHLLMWVIGAKQRFGFPHAWSHVLLNRPVARRCGHRQHKVEDWRDLTAGMGYGEAGDPELRLAAYRTKRVDEVLGEQRSPVLVLHTGARIAVRRWPLAYYEEVILRLRRSFRFFLVLIPDPDGCGSKLSSLADAVLNDLTLMEMIDTVGRADFLLCNDSGPGHIAAACGTPSISLFGPTEADWFRPWGPLHRIILRDNCPHRPCFDYCHFSEPHCMTRLTPATVWPEVEAHLCALVARGSLPESFLLAPGTVSGQPLVAAVVATYNRPLELARLLQSLKGTPTPLGVVVVDNADDPATAAVIEAAQGWLDVARVVPGSNLGCGGGLAYGEAEALKRFGHRLTHFWVMDDDAEVLPGALEALLAAMDQEKAVVATPMVLNDAGEIGWFPGLLQRDVFNAVRKNRVRQPAEYHGQFGHRPVPFSWSTGISLLAERGAVEAVGLHRTDFLIRGEDLDFSLRLTAWGKGIYVPDAEVRHLPPPGLDTPQTRQSDRRKHAILLQNLAFISLHLRHGRRILRTLPGNFLRYVRTWGLFSTGEALAAFWVGAVRSWPAGYDKASEPVKLLVFAHTPPPYHGQSFMVQLMLNGFGGDARHGKKKGIGGIECYHVNCSLSKSMEDIGCIRWGKVLLLLRYCLEAIWCRLRYGVRNFYYVPAPGKQGALYRDWMVLLICRPFFPNLVFHWHATGLTQWLDHNGNAWEKWITRRLHGAPELSIPLAEASSMDAAWLKSQKTIVVPNGIPDPCPDFQKHLLPRRKARIEARRQEPGKDSIEIRLLYMAHCTRDKGLFDALEGVALFNRNQTRWRAHFSVAGAFMDLKEEREFQERIQRPDLAGAVTYIGFASGDKKKALFEESDCLCFPTYYLAESFPLTLVEAAAYGLPSVVTRWRAIPEIQPPDYPGFVDARAPDQIAAVLECLAVADFTELLRERFLARFSEEMHLRQLAEAIRAR
ncbi:MAG: glycosyltransferase family 9 protein [Chthoniobacteraceae bacterium]